jgi:hypothetical protein
MCRSIPNHQIRCLFLSMIFTVNIFCYTSIQHKSCKSCYFMEIVMVLFSLFHSFSMWFHFITSVSHSDGSFFLLCCAVLSLQFYVRLMHPILVMQHVRVGYLDVNLYGSSWSNHPNPNPNRLHIQGTFLPLSLSLMHHAKSLSFRLHSSSTNCSRKWCSLRHF